jgi:hypothetical protein
MDIKLAFLATLEAKEGKGEELGKFLEAGRELAVAEEETVTWYAFRVDETHYGIFDTFATEEGRQAHVKVTSPKPSTRPLANCWPPSRRSHQWTSSRSSDRDTPAPRTVTGTDSWRPAPPAVSQASKPATAAT